MTPFQDWLEQQLSAVGQARILARRIGVDDAAIHSWLYRGILPTPTHEMKLAEATGEPLDKIQTLVERSWRVQRAALDQRRKNRRPTIHSCTKIIHIIARAIIYWHLWSVQRRPLARIAFPRQLIRRQQVGG